ncbi:MAG: NADH-quinone oxidoreductase subunit NuoG [Deltaproteobacteria bacterium]|nr:NADH-quinone oxidoreductase subunit NuoG [Deltaproteobacteria bacterium]MBW2072088.1 NADH-quinone oxidoreductase subunit NuoG [Deltaproteobacteria bacterium]
MPTIVIDDLEIEVVEGTRVIEAAEQLGIMIPRFCYHPALGSVGACRVCAVKFLQGPVKGMQMSCMVEATDGMVVSTVDEEAVAFRRQVIEWLMLNHPHDCPVCDEGGHCLLQDMTVSGGHGIRRYLGRKRTYHDQYLGPLVQHEMNRCIHCYRCVRYYQEFCGYRDLGVMQSGSRTYFGRFIDGVLESPFAGNLIDVCPTGVYTDRPSRFKGRQWDFQRAPSLCLNCSLGCHITANARYREVVRLEARPSEVVNGHFVCDRGRYGFEYVNHPERPRQARVDGRLVGVPEAIDISRQRLAEIAAHWGQSSIAGVGSARSSLESQAALKQVCGATGWRGPVFFTTADQARKVRAAAAGISLESAASLSDFTRADFLLAVGADPLQEAPMAALAMRQAVRAGARAVVLDPRPVSLPFNFSQLCMPPDEIEFHVGLLVKGAIEKEAVEHLSEELRQVYQALPSDDFPASGTGEKTSELAAVLKGCQHPLLACGTDVVRTSTPALVAACVQLLRAAGKEASLGYFLPGPNSFAAALLHSGQTSVAQLVDEIEAGTVKAVIVVEADPLRYFPHKARLQQALAKLDLLVVLDYLASETGKQAHIFLPTLTIYEAGGTFINQEGRVQRAAAVQTCGTPLIQVAGGAHPPRSYSATVPGGESSSAWQILLELGKDQPGGVKIGPDLWSLVKGSHEVLADLPPPAEFPAEGIRVACGPGTTERPAINWSGQKTGSGSSQLEILTVDRIFGTEELSIYSPALQQLEEQPCLFIHADDAAQRGLTDGERVIVQLESGTLEADLSVRSDMARGVLLLPRHRLLSWQQLGVGVVRVPMEKVKKAAAM